MNPETCNKCITTQTNATKAKPITSTSNHSISLCIFSHQYERPGPRTKLYQGRTYLDVPRYPRRRKKYCVADPHGVYGHVLLNVIPSSGLFVPSIALNKEKEEGPRRREGEREEKIKKSRKREREGRKRSRKRKGKRRRERWGSRMRDRKKGREKEQEREKLKEKER
jgi:hypothetical protein